VWLNPDVAGLCTKALQVSSQWADSFDVLLKQYQKFGESIPAFVLVRSLPDNQGHHNEIINSIFGKIFTFHKLALHYFRKTGKPTEASSCTTCSTHGLLTISSLAPTFLGNMELSRSEVCAHDCRDK
jgi:hypothetical protein